LYAFVTISDFSLTNKFYKLLDINTLFHFIFILRNETELSQVNNFIEKEKIESYKLLPIFTGKNLSFLKKNVFTTLSDLNELNPSQLDLYRNHKINSLIFGKLYISSSGEISSNIASPIIGKLGKTSINQIVLEEILNSRNWLSLRSNVEPCKNCIYCDFCPPLSNYEKAIGKNNLCNI
jgi:pseudo-rSAM protein